MLMKQLKDLSQFFFEHKVYPNSFKEKNGTFNFQQLKIFFRLAGKKRNTAILANKIILRNVQALQQP